MPDLATIVYSLGLSGLLSGFLIWISKAWISERLKSAIQHEYDQKLETFKAKIKSEADISIEQLKSQLQIAAAERNIRYSRVFERTAETVAEAYEKLIALNDAIADYTKPFEFESDPPKSERRKVVSERYQESLKFFRPRRIYLKMETADQVEKFHNQLYKVVVTFASQVEANPKGGEEYLDVWMETSKFVATELPKLLGLLERDFRQILGITAQN